MRISRPKADELPPNFVSYVDPVTGDDAVAALLTQRESTARFLSAVPEAKAAFRYAAGKWSLREVVGHVSDSERVFAYRMLRFARADATPLPGFDENHWMPAAGFERRSLANVLEELLVVRAATLALVRSLDEVALDRRGSANGVEISVRALAWAIAGHEAHHMRVIRERYWEKLAGEA